MKLKNFEEFITDLTNCKDIEELFKCLSSADAHQNYHICLFKRYDSLDGFNDDFAKEIMLRDFLIEWVSGNEGFFIDDDIKYLIDLIRTTNNYLVNKYEKTFNTALQRTPHNQRLNNTKRYQDSVKKHLEAVKRDLQEIHPQGGKTKSLLNLINEALLDMDSIVPIVKTPKANTDELTRYLNKLETKIGLTKVAIKEYREFFQNYYPLEVADNFYFSKDTTHITS